MINIETGNRGPSQVYKPAAAIVYAAAFQLAGTDVFSDDGSGLLAVLTGPDLGQFSAHLSF